MFKRRFLLFNRLPHDCKLKIHFKYTVFITSDIIDKNSKNITSESK